MAAPCSPSFVFKKGCMDVPLVGKVALTVLEGISVDNKNKQGGGAEAIINRIEEMEKSDPLTHRPLLIFPEGTTSNGSCLLKFRTGGFVAGAAVQPIVIQFPFKHFSPAYESIYTSVVIFRTLCQFHNRMQVRYLDAHIPTEIEKREPAIFAAEVRRKMAVALDIPLCDVGYTEKKEYHAILSRRLKSHCLGWLSNFMYLHPKHLPDEPDPIQYIYQGNQTGEFTLSDTI